MYSDVLSSASIALNAFLSVVCFRLNVTWLFSPWSCTHAERSAPSKPSLHAVVWLAPSCTLKSAFRLPVAAAWRIVRGIVTGKGVVR